MHTLATTHYISLAGEMIIGSIDNHLCMCDWASRGAIHRALLQRLCLRMNAVSVSQDSDVITHAISQLDQYFAGARREFDIPVTMVGTEFQRRVWLEIARIPYGQTISYAELACRIGNPRAVRAVAAATAANPMSLIVPCHRVIGSRHTLTGYAGGLDAKRMLLHLENPQYDG